MKQFKNFLPSPCGVIDTRPGFKAMPLPNSGLFHRIGVKLGIIPEVTYINMIIFEDSLFVATNYGVFRKDENDVFHPLKFLPAEKETT
jgi:hypothetical protein